MDLRRVSFFFPAVCALGLLASSCQKEPAGSTSYKTLSPSWPPDTMMVTPIGSGHLMIVATWKAHGPDGHTVPLTKYAVVGLSRAPVSAAGTMLRHTPPDTTASTLKRILDQPSVADSWDALILAQWIPDTTLH